MDGHAAELPEKEPDPTPYEPLPANFKSPRVAALVKRLEERVIGQPEAMRELAMAAEYAFSGLRDPSRPNKPIAVMIFLGPSGVGKTESARAFAEAFLGSAARLKTIDCTQLTEPHEVATLKGSPYGYIGSDEPAELCQFYVDLGYLKQQAESGAYFKLQRGRFEQQIASKETELFEVRQEIIIKQSKELTWRKKQKELKAKPAAKLIQPEIDALPIYEGHLREMTVEIAALQEKEKKLSQELATLQSSAVWFAKIENQTPQERLECFKKYYCDKDDIKNYNKNPDPEAMSVILFDEIEKAHEVVSRMLLRIFDDGILELRNGGRTNFKNSVIFLTSNLGSEEIKKLLQGAGGASGDAIGFPCRQNAEASTSIVEIKAESYGVAIKEICRKEFKEYFPAPFVGRVEREICFQPLNYAHMLAILDRFICDFNRVSGESDFKQAVSVSLTLTVSESLKHHIIQKATLDWEEGARRIYGVFCECVLDTLIPLINGGIIQPYDEVFASLSGDSVTLFRRPGLLPPEVHLLGSVP